MGNQCCTNNGDGEVNEIKGNSTGKIQQHSVDLNLYDNNASLSVKSHQLAEPFNEKDVEMKHDVQVGEGATYTG